VVTRLLKVQIEDFNKKPVSKDHRLSRKAGMSAEVGTIPIHQNKYTDMYKFTYIPFYSLKIF